MPDNDIGSPICEATSKGAPFSRYMLDVPEWQWCQRWSHLLARIADGDDQAHRTFLHDLGFWVDKVYLGNQRLCAHQAVVASIVASIDAQLHRYVPGSPVLPWVRAIADYRLAHPKSTNPAFVQRHAASMRVWLQQSARMAGRIAGIIFH